MSDPKIIKVGDIITFKKPHPCGGWEWEVLRVGMDFRLKCLQCGRQIMLSNVEVKKRLKNKKT